MRFRRNQRRSKDTSFPSFELHERKKEQPIWKSAIDPTSGRTYYFEVLSRKSQWEKPEELISAEEREVLERKYLEDTEFFKVMERNIHASLAKGQLVPGSDAPLDASNSGASPKGLNASVWSLPHMLAPPLSPTSSSSTSEDESKELNEIGAENLNAARNKRVAPPLVKASKTPSISRTPDSLGEESGSLSSPTSSPASKHVRRNTSGTIYIAATISSPDVDATIRCVCKVYRQYMIETAPEGGTSSPVSVQGVGCESGKVFDDDYYSAGSKILQRICKTKSFSPRSFYSPVTFHNEQPQGPVIDFPTLEEVTIFYKSVYNQSQLEFDVIVISLIYIERLIRETSGRVRPTPQNWRSILFSALILASKVWDDLSMWNIDFSHICERGAPSLSSFTLKRINELEVAMLKSLNFNVKVAASDYTKYYFQLGDAARRDGMVMGENKTAMQPLDKEGAVALEMVSAKYQHKAMANAAVMARNRRSKSLGDYGPIYQEFMKEDCCKNYREGSIVAVPDDTPHLRAIKSSICLEQVVSM